MSESPSRLRTYALRAVILIAALLLLAGAVTLLRPVIMTPTPTPQPTPTSWPMETQFTSPEYGINVHLWWDEWAAIRRDWPLVKDAGFTWAKQRLAWHDVEGAGPGRYEWAATDRIVREAVETGVQLVFRVDMPPVWARPVVEPDDLHPLPVDLDAFQSFCNHLASRYRGQVRGYQVWNEPNLSREWGDRPPDPVGYTAVLRACYIGIKTADPGALVISAGLAPTGSGLPAALPDADYLAGMYQAGAAAYFDLLGLNAPGYKAAPEVSPDEAADPANDLGGHRVFCFRHVEDMRAIMVAHGDADKQVAILEFGWHVNVNPDHSDYTWFSVTPETQADYLVRALQYARDNWSPWIGPMFVWTLPDSKWTPDNEEYWWAIADPFWWGFDGEFETWAGAGVRPAYDALKAYMNP